MARRRGTRRPSHPQLGEATLAWHALGLQAARQVSVKELHSAEPRHVHTHRLFIKLCWLMSTHVVSADRVVNIDETSYRLLPVHPSDRVGPPRRETSSDAGQHEGGHDNHGRLQRGPWRLGHAGKTDAVLPEQPWPEHTHRVTSENGWAPRRAEPEQGRTSVDPSLGRGITIAMKATFLHVVLCFLPPHSTSYLQPCGVAVFGSFKSCIQAQASATLAPCSRRRLVW